MSLPLNQEAQKRVNDPLLWRSCSPDHPPCGICGKFIEDIPIRLTKLKENLEIAFHIECAVENSFKEESENGESGQILIACNYCEKKKKCIYFTDKNRFPKNTLGLSKKEKEN